MNWREYNDYLVKRGELLLDFSILGGWGDEVKRMSIGRRGRPFHLSRLSHQASSIHQASVSSSL